MSEEFDYAVCFLREQGEEHYELPKDQTINLRDSVFDGVLLSFDNQPVSISQVGAIETFDRRFRVGSGWSDIIFGKYIREHGGKLKIIDINLDHLANSALASLYLKYPIEMRYGDAGEHIEEGCDIYYLDGADEPLGNIQTLQQFKKIENTKSVVIVDDIKTKAAHLIEYLNKKNINFVTHNAGSGMMTIDMREIR